MIPCFYARRQNDQKFERGLLSISREGREAAISDRHGKEIVRLRNCEIDTSSSGVLTVCGYVGNDGRNYRLECWEVVFHRSTANREEKKSR